MDKGGGGNSINIPKPPSFPKEYKEGTNTYLGHLPDYLGAEMGSRQNPLYGDTSRIAWQQFLQNEFGPTQYNQQLGALGQIDPTGSALRSQTGAGIASSLANNEKNYNALAGNVFSDLSKGTGLTDSLKNTIDDATLRAQAARGNVYGQAPVEAQAFAEGQAGQNLYQQRLQNAQSVLGEAGAPFSSALQFQNSATPESWMQMIAPVSADRSMAYVNPNAGFLGVNAVNGQYQNMLGAAAAGAQPQNNSWMSAIGGIASILPLLIGGFAGGGRIPGVDRGMGDTKLAMVTPGEVVLNKDQQAQVGYKRIMDAIGNRHGKPLASGAHAFSGGGSVSSEGGPGGTWIDGHFYNSGNTSPNGQGPETNIWGEPVTDVNGNPVVTDFSDPNFEPTPIPFNSGGGNPSTVGSGGSPGNYVPPPTGGFPLVQPPGVNMPPNEQPPPQWMKWMPPIVKAGYGGWRIAQRALEAYRNWKGNHPSQGSGDPSSSTAPQQEPHGGWNPFGGLPEGFTEGNRFGGGAPTFEGPGFVGPEWQPGGSIFGQLPGVRGGPLPGSFDGLGSGGGGSVGLLPIGQTELRHFLKFGMMPQDAFGHTGDVAGWMNVMKNGIDNPAALFSRGNNGMNTGRAIKGNG